MKRVCVFCGSRSGDRPIHAEKTRALGEALVRRGIGLVFGAGHIGLMGVLAEAVLQAGGEVIGVIPQGLVDRELAHTGLTELRIVGTMHQRKAVMEELSDAFVALPGGFGTCDELFEILTWRQLDLHHKPIGMLEVDGYFAALLDWLDHAVSEGFLRSRHRHLLQVSEDPDLLLDLLLPADRCH